MTRKTRNPAYDAFVGRILTADHLVTQRDCGCIVLALFDEPSVVKDCRDDIVREAMAGRALRRYPKGQLPPFVCPLHVSVTA